MATPPPERLLALLTGHQASIAELRARLDRYAALVWANLGSYRDEDIERLLDLLLPRMLAGQRQAAALTDAYVAAATGQRSLGVDAALVTGAAVRGGADPREVYRRPAVALYTALSKGVPVDEAVVKGGRRLSSLVLTDVQLAKRQQFDLSMASAGVHRYRRVLTGRESCALCAIASTQTYRTGNLLPIHPGCDCDVAQVDDGDVASGVNRQRLDAVHADVMAQLGARDLSGRDVGLGHPIADYLDVVVTHEHGEYGPTLAYAGDHFTGPGDLAA